MKPLWISLCLLVSLGARAQDSTRTTLADNAPVAPVTYTVPVVWRVDFLGLGPLVETRLGPKTTLNSGLYFGGSLESQARIGPGQTAQTDWSYELFVPVLHTGVRYFYNFERRLARNKSIRYNSGNYLSLRARYVFGPLISRYDAGPIVDGYRGPALDALWGFQRTYRRNFYLNLSLGLGLFPNASRVIGGAGDFTLGYTFPNRKAGL